jgi:ABC-2 type transport system permease protein
MSEAVLSDDAVAPARLPGILPAGVARSRVELATFFRNRQSLMFTLLFPILMLVILGSIFHGTVEGTDVDFKQVFIAGIVAAGIMSTGFSGLAINVAMERDSGMLRRLVTSPMPKAAYFAGKLVRVGVTAIIETVVLMIIGVLAFGLTIPTDAARWITLLLVLVFGSIVCALMAIAYSSLIPNAAAAAAIVTPPFIALQFISGIFFPFSQLPAWMQTIAAFFPLKWMAQALRYVFLPDSFQVVEPAGNWELGNCALVIGLWGVAMVVVCLLTFRWKSARIK